MGCRLSFTIIAASLGVVTPRVQTINNGIMATCTGHLPAGEAIKFVTIDGLYLLHVLVEVEISLIAGVLEENRYSRGRKAIESNSK
ncbi:hypothetical protein TNCV_4691011 [Trichonephila clavipes]|nr:hypothetical protein TNCV_4691011 [Trichonephila clavipes]